MCKSQDKKGNPKTHCNLQMHKIFQFITEVIGWIQIMLSPFLIGIFFGAVIYLPNPTSVRFYMAIAVVVAGLLVGVIWATKIWKTKGTIWYVSQVSATAELDKQNEGVTDEKGSC
jgi:hypothetical protein